MSFWKNFREGLSKSLNEQMEKDPALKEAIDKASRTGQSFSKLLETSTQSIKEQSEKLRTTIQSVSSWIPPQKPNSSDPASASSSDQPSEKPAESQSADSSSSPPSQSDSAQAPDQTTDPTTGSWFRQKNPFSSFRVSDLNSSTLSSLSQKLAQTVNLSPEQKQRLDELRQSVSKPLQGAKESIKGSLHKPIQKFGEQTTKIGEKFSEGIDCAKQSEVLKSVSSTASSLKHKADRIIAKNTQASSIVDNVYSSLDDREKTSRVIEENNEQQDVVVVEQPKLISQFEAVKTRISTSKPVRMASDLKVSLEESENPIVQSTMDVVDSVVAKTGRAAHAVVGETEQSRVLTALKAVVGSSFSVQRLVDDIHTEMASRYLQAAATGDLVTLEGFCGQGLLMRHGEAQKTRRKLQHKVTYNLLDIGDVELERAFFHNDSPTLLFSFEAQENHYVKSPSGEFIFGSAHDIKQTKYIWRMEFDVDRQKWILAEEAKVSETALSF